MPVVLRIGPYAFFFYAEEGREPPHIHIRRDDAEMKVWLDTFEVAFRRGYSSREQRQIVKLVMEHHDLLLEAWHDFFTRREGR